MSTCRPRLDRSAAAIGLLTVLAANCLYLAGLPLILEPMVSTEPFYIDLARLPAASLLDQDPAWGLLYVLWLKPFRAVLSDPLAVYPANLYALSFGVSRLIYLYLLLLTRRAAVGVGAALVFLISDLNVPLANKVSGFALMVLLAGLALSELVPAGARRMSVTAAGTLLASYARPELYPAAPCLWLAALWLARSETRASGRSVLLWPAAVLGLMLTAAVRPGTPVFSPYSTSDRMILAFREHFAWNWTRWHDQAADFMSIWEREFGAAHSVPEALWNNPGAVVHHLIDNLLGTAAFLGGSAFDHYPLLAPAAWPALVKAESLAVSAAVFGSLGLIAVRAGWRRQMIDRYGHALLPYAIIAACSVASAMVIFPVVHYLAIPAVLLLLAGAMAASLIVPAGRVSSWRLSAVAALVCLAAVPRPFILPSAYVVPGSLFKAQIAVSRPVTELIAFVRSLGLPAPVRVLTFTDGLGELLGPGFQEVKIWKRGTQPLQAYLRDKHVDVIVSMEPGQESFLLGDPYWKVIQYTPEATGFTRVPVPNQEAVRVFVRTDLVRPDEPPPVKTGD